MMIRHFCIFLYSFLPPCFASIDDILFHVMLLISIVYSVSSVDICPTEIYEDMIKQMLRMNLKCVFQLLGTLEIQRIGYVIEYPTMHYFENPRHT